MLPLYVSCCGFASSSCGYAPFFVYFVPSAFDCSSFVTILGLFLSEYVGKLYLQRRLWGVLIIGKLILKFLIEIFSTRASSKFGYSTEKVDKL